MTLCKENIDVGNNLPIKFEMDKSEECSIHGWHVELNKKEHSIMFEILKYKTIMQIAKNKKLSKEVLLKEIIRLFSKFDLEMKPEFIENNLGHKQLRKLILFYYSMGIFTLRFDNENIKEIISKINQEEIFRRSLQIKTSLSELETNVIKGLVEGRKITEIDNAIRLNNHKLNYQKVTQTILHKMNANNLAHATYKAIKLSII